MNLVELALTAFTASFAGSFVGWQLNSAWQRRTDRIDHEKAMKKIDALRQSIDETRWTLPVD